MKKIKEMSIEEKRLYHKNYMIKYRLNNKPTPEEMEKKSLEKQKRKEQTKLRRKEKGRQKYKDDPEFRRKQKILILQWRYGLTEDEILELNKITECPICKAQFGATILQDKKIHSKMPCVDHDHKTNKVRGVLCSSCNRMVGFIEEMFCKITPWIQSASLISK